MVHGQARRLPDRWSLLNAMRHLPNLLVLASIALAGSAPALAEGCSAGDLAAAVDAAGATLRTYNAEAQPVLADKLEMLRKKKGWSREEAEEKSLEYLSDPGLADLDRRSDELLTRIDSLGRPENAARADCTSIAEVSKAGDELLGVMKSRSARTLARLDEELGIETPSPGPARRDAPSSPAGLPAKSAAEKAPATPAPSSAPPKAAGPPEAPAPATSTSSWQTTAGPAPPQLPPGGPFPLPPEAFVGDEEGYTLAEIREATSGFFGTVSTNLATVLEHAFSVAGRPTAYVLGKEGGGAFLAGLRYGEGSLFMRNGGKSKVYWHGPSIGTDFGADGSRTLFLIYKLKEPEDLYRAYTGLDGSAYLVGGVGFTLMKGGKVVLAPIRSGLGLRIGANIGYVRFTPRATWNPF